MEKTQLPGTDTGVVLMEIALPEKRVAGGRIWYTRRNTHKQKRRHNVNIP
jgi:hypothetical protein